MDRTHLAIPARGEIPHLRRLCLGLVALGVLWRFVRYFLQFPIWGDEAFVCVNLLDSDYAGLTGPLRCGQVAPLFFLWSELAVYQAFGGSELAVRLVPFLAGLASLPLFWRLAWRTLPPLAACFAVATLSVAFWPVMMSCTVKPYALDLFLSLTLLVLAADWLDHPEGPGRLAALALLCPVALFGSFPAAFVAGGVSLALLPAIWRRPGWTCKSIYLLMNLAMLAAFAVHYALIANHQLAGEVHDHLSDYWADGFPPGDWSFFPWFALVHAGRMAAYPIGDANGGSAATTLLAVTGLIALWRQPAGRRWMLLFLAPFALNFLAAIMRKYPYGGCCRLSQHLAPATCLLVGAGVAYSIEWWTRTPAARRRLVHALAALLALVPIVGMARDFYRPYDDFAPYWARGIVRELFAQAEPGEPVVILNDRSDIDPVFEWLLARHRDRVLWQSDIDEAALRGGGPVWILRFRCAYLPDPAQMPLTQPSLMQSYEPHRVRGPMDQARRLGQATVMYCDVYRWTWSAGEWREMARPDLSMWPRRR